MFRRTERAHSKTIDSREKQTSVAMQTGVIKKRQRAFRKSRKGSTPGCNDSEGMDMDTDFIALSSTQSIIDEDARLSHLSQVEAAHDPPGENDIFSCKFRGILETIFDRKENKTVLIPQAQIKKIERSIAADYTEGLLHHSGTARHGVDLHLLCASLVMDQFWEAQEMILQTNMPRTAQESVFYAVENYIWPRIVDQFYPMSDLTPDAAAMAISWMCIFEDKLTCIAPDLALREEWGEERQCLLNYYLDRAVRHETTILLQEVLKLHSDDNLRREAEGNVVTSFPEETSYIINQQLHVASACLPDRFKEDVLVFCNQELSSMMSDLSFRISSEWKSLSSAYFCATINDTTRLAEYCEERHEEYLARPELIESAHEVTRDITEASLHATRYLCERVIYDLCEPTPVLNSIGDVIWESPEGHPAVEQAIATFTDYFADLEEWLISDYFFPKVLRNCFDLALKTYLESFFANTMIRGVNDPMAVAKELEQDYLRFVEYFNGEHFIEYHGRGGFYSQKIINDHLRILQHMAALVDPTNLPVNLSFEIQEVLAFFEEENGAPAVLHLVGLRQRQRGVNSIHWVKAIAEAKKNLAECDGQCERPGLSCKLPDVRNSRMLRKIRVPARSEIPRQISNDSRPFAESTVRMLQPPSGVSLAPCVNISSPMGAALWSSVMRSQQDKQGQARPPSPPPPCCGQEQHPDEKESVKENNNPEETESVEKLEYVQYFEGRMLAEF